VGRGLVPRRRAHPVRRAAGDKPPPYMSKSIWSSTSEMAHLAAYVRPT